MFDSMTKPTYGDPASWLETIWDALHLFQENCLPIEEEYDHIWDNITFAMARIEETMLDAENGGKPRG